MFTVACFNFKGGVGKSTTVANLGACLATTKRSVVAIDLDGQRTLSFALGVDGQQPTAIDWLESEATPIPTNLKNFQIIPGDISLFRLSSEQDLIGLSLKRLMGFDVCLMDCPPSLGWVAVQAILNADRVLLPTLCEPAALKGLAEAVDLIRSEKEDIPIDVVRTRYKSRLVLTREVDDLLIEAAEDLGYRLLHTTIPENIQVAESIAQQQPITQYASQSNGAKAFKSLAKEITKVWGIQ